MSSVSLDIPNNIGGLPDFISGDETVNDKVYKVYIYSIGLTAASCLTAVTAAKLGIGKTLQSVLITNPLTMVPSIAILVSLMAATTLTSPKNFLFKQGCCGLFAISHGLLFSTIVNKPGILLLNSIGSLALSSGLGALVMNISNGKREAGIAGGLAAITMGSYYAASNHPASTPGIIHLAGKVSYPAFSFICNISFAKRAATDPNFDPIKCSMRIFQDFYLVTWIFHSMITKCSEGFRLTRALLTSKTEDLKASLQRLSRKSS